MGECLIIRSGGGADTSDATVSGSYILTGYSCYVNDVKVIGTMPNRASVTPTLDPGEQYTIPYGYHNGNGEISVSSLADNTPATADSRWILWAKTGWVNGELVAGAMVNRGSVTQTLSVNGSYTIPVGWHSGSGRVSQNLATQGSVNMTPTTTNQTACPANRWTTGSIIIVGSSNLTAGNIKKGVNIFGVTGTWIGWVDSKHTLIDQTTTSNITTKNTNGGYIELYSYVFDGDYLWGLQLSYPCIHLVVTNQLTFNNTESTSNISVGTDTVFSLDELATSYAPTYLEDLNNTTSSRKSAKSDVVRFDFAGCTVVRAVNRYRATGVASITLISHINIYADSSLN